ncbi:MAG TPA: tetratricopeptide repeat protein, partial [Verrucomicrobiae bacterium]
MPLRIFVFIILAGSFGALLLGGCTTPGKSGKTSSTTNTTATVQKRGEEIDYSPEAVERRTEAHARYATGVLLDWQEEPEQAADEFYKAALADPNNVDLVLEVSQRLMQLKQYEKAAEVLNKATSASKVSGLVYAQLGRVYALMGKKEMAIDADKIAIKRNPGNLMGYRNLAQMYVQNRQVEEGLKVLDQASKQINVDETFLIELAELYTGFLRLGTNEAVRKNAIDTVDRATAAEPKNPLLLQRIADVYAITGQTDKATDYYLKVLEKIPSMPGLREKLVEMYLKKEDRKHAAEQLETIIRNNPTNPQYYYLLGSIAYEEKDLKKATEYFSKTILLNPDFEQVYYDLAGAQINMNKAKEALATLQKARDKFKETFVQEFFEALAYTHLKDFTNAINHFTAAEVIARATETNKLNHIFYYQ